MNNTNIDNLRLHVRRLTVKTAKKQIEHIDKTREITFKNQNTNLHTLGTQKIKVPSTTSQIHPLACPKTSKNPRKTRNELFFSVRLHQKHEKF
jgi:hypothetical protein